MATETRSTKAATVDHPQGQTSRLSGRVVPYGQPADIGWFTEEFRRGAFRNSLELTPNVPLLMYHDDASDPIGVGVEWDDRPDGLHGTFRLDSSPRALEAARLVGGGFLAFMSIRFMPISSLWDFAGGSVDKDHVVRTQARLLEVSLVSTPAYPLATVTEVRHVDPLVVLCRDLGAPAMRSAVTGDAAQIRSAVNMVRLFAEEHGERAAAELEAFAAHAKDPTLATNLARAAMVLHDDPAAARRVHLNYWRGELASLKPAGAGLSSFPTRRRRHR